MKPFCFVLLGLVLLAACQPIPLLPSVTPVLHPTATPTEPAPSATSSPIPSPEPTLTATEPPHPPVTRVVIMSIDGLRPDAIDQAPMPTLQELMRTGAYTLSAQTINPSTTLPSHASMLTGLCPSAHGVTWDTYQPENGYAVGEDLFDLAHAAGLRTVMVVGKEKLQQVTEPSSLDVFQWVNDPDLVVAKRAAVRIQQGFGVLFIHFPDTDLAGHSYGWLSQEQLLSLRGTDDAVRVILDALDEAQMRLNTLIIVTADHGGHYTSHGFDIPADMTIPWIVNGPGVVPAQLQSAVNTTDTAATAAWALDLPLPAEWAGRPVLEAFGFPDEAARPSPRCP